MASESEECKVLFLELAFFEDCNVVRAGHALTLLGLDLGIPVYRYRLPQEPLRRRRERRLQDPAA